MFKHLIGYITLYTIDYVKRELDSAKEFRNDYILVGQELENFLYTIVPQFSLRCRHRLATLLALEPIPMKLLHPQCRIVEVPIDSTSWIIPWPHYLKVVVDIMVYS